MKKITLLVLGISLLAIYLFSLAAPANAAAAFQLTPFPTPTPGPDGQIRYIVKAGDTLWRIAAVSGVSLDDLRFMNNLGDEEIIVEGQTLVLGLGGPSAQATLEPGETPVPVTVEPTPTEGPGTAIVCVLLFEDINGDALRQETEFSVAGGAISLSERSGGFMQNITTTDSEETPCFEDVPEGDYNVSVGVPEGYNPTTEMNLALDVGAGDESFLNFGVQQNSQTALEDLPVEGGGRSPLLGVVGFALVLLGIGLGVFSTRIGRPKSS